MRVCIIGGIFDKPPMYRETHQVTPETVLATGLSARGVDVQTFGHRAAVDLGSFDVVHVHHLDRGATTVAFDRSQTPFVYTHHRPFFSPPPWRTRVLAADPLRPGLRGLRAGWATTMVMASADRVIALSDTEALFHRTAYHVPPPVQAVIPNGIPPERFSAARTALTDPPEIVFVGQLVRFKRVDLLIDAFADVSREVPGTLRIIHQVDELRDALEAQARDRGLGDRIQFEGALPPEQIAQVLAGATALVLPSDMEALPSVVTEALLVGTPVVATNVGGVREQVGSSGYVVERGNREALANALRAVLNQRDRWLGATPEIRADARLRFGVDRMVDDHIALYESMVATRREPRRRRSLLRPIAAVGRVAISGR